MAKVSQELRERLLNQKKKMQRGGMLIRNKGFTRMKLRILPPAEGELPGVEYQSFFSKPLNKGTTSPLCWGVPCPIADELDRIYREGTKEDKDQAKAFCRRNVEYWIPVIDRADEGTPQNPKLRILQGKQGIYQSITDWMLDEEDGEDITNPTEGRDVVIKRKGAGLDTEWSIDKGDKCLISEDEEMANAWVELASKFDVKTRFYIPKLDVLQEMYRGLKGEKMPASYLDPIKELIKQLESGGQVDPDSDDDAVVAEATEATEEAPVEEAVAEETTEEVAAPVEDGDLTGRTVQFESDGATVQGTVLGLDEDEEGCWLIAEDGGNPDEPFSVSADQLTLVEETVEETEVAEEAPAPAPVRRKPTPAPAPAPKAAPAPVKVAPKPAPKPAVTRTTIAAKPAAAPAPVKTAAKPVAGLPRKPAAAAPAPAAKASTAIKQTLKAKANAAAGRK